MQFGTSSQTTTFSTGLPLTNLAVQRRCPRNQMSALPAAWKQAVLRSTIGFHVSASVGQSPLLSTVLEP